MSFDSLEKLLRDLEESSPWDNYQQYCLIVKVWEKIVPSKMLPYTRPLYVARNILWVATASSVWAQTLSLKRYGLLKDLNAELPQKLTDIRFSSAQWSDRNPVNPPEGLPTLRHLKDHPSYVTAPEQTPNPPQPKTPQEALQQWLARCEMRSQHLPLCPQCQSPTPPGELERWGVCAACLGQEK